MKKMMIILTVLLVLFPLFADEPVTHLRSQEVGGYVDDIVDLAISSFSSPDVNGINLDYTDENSCRHQPDFHRRAS